MVGCASRDTRWLTTSRTLSGLASSAGASELAVPFTISSAPVSLSVRHSSIMRNALPSVSSLISCASSAVAGSRSPPRGLAHELGDLLVAQATQRQALDALHATEVDERLG